LILGFDPQELNALIDRDGIARDTLDFVRIESETGTEGKGSEVFAHLLRREGLEPEFDAVAPSRPNVYARLTGTKCESERALMFNGHVDTIPVGNCDAPSFDGEWIIGRGAEDMKGGLVAMVHAASAIRKMGLTLAGHLTLTAVVGHETPVGNKEGAKRLIALVRAGDLPATGMIIVEGPKAIWAASPGSVILHLPSAVRVALFTTCT